MGMVLGGGLRSLESILHPEDGDTVKTGLRT
jgi:hypothetical protein